jgi:hypothetical protein
MGNRHSLVGALAVSLALSACTQEPTESSSPAPGTGAPAFARSAPAPATAANAKLREINAGLAKAGARYAVAMAEVSLSPKASVDRAQIVFAFDRTLRLPSKWVPGDARRNADGNNITYMNDLNFMTANGAGNAEPSIDASFATWQQVKCSKLTLVKRPYDGELHSVFFGGDPFVADIYTLGFLPGFIFDQFLGPGASENVLGVTFTFIFGDFDADGNFTPSDIDNNGREDTALKEVWYNDAFTWTTTNTTDIDIESVAVHENGHTLELGHFGRVAFNTSSGKLQVSPRAIMNAFILGVLRSPLGTDNGAYCGNYASWPN